MTSLEAQKANALHAIWDILIMHHSVESAADAHDVPLIALTGVAREVLAKVKEYECYEKRRSSKGV